MKKTTLKYKKGDIVRWIGESGNCDCYDLILDVEKKRRLYHILELNTGEFADSVSSKIYEQESELVA